MAWRKWIVRGLVFTVAGGLAVAVLLYQHWTNPTIVRQQVLAQLGAHLPGAAVNVDSARLRLLGGIALSELRLSRRDDPDRTDVLYVPSGVIYHDKEQLLDGKLVIRKIELHRPRFRVVRGRDGRWNTKGILGPVDLSKTIPTIVIQQGTIFFEDHNCPALPVMEIKDVHLTVLNDPLATLVIQGTGQSDLAGSVQIRATLQRATDEFDLTLDVPAVPVGPTLVQRLAAYFPDAANDARHLEGAGKLDARFHYHPGDAPYWTHDVRGTLRKGSFRHAQVPLPLDDLEATLRCTDGRLKLERLTARSGETRVELSGAAEALGPEADLTGELKVVNLPLSRDLFDRLPAPLREVHADFAPAGPIDLTWTVRRENKQWRQQGVIAPRGLSVCCDKFRYPLERLTGTLDVKVAPEGHLEQLAVKLVGYTGARPIHITGTLAGPKPAALDFTLTGSDLPLDETLLAALHPAPQKLARAFHLQGKADFEVFIKRSQGEAQPVNRFVVRFKDTALRYDVFPYPLERVTGTLDILPDHWEMRDFRGTHKGAEVEVTGRSIPAPEGQRVAIELRGKNLLLDPELKTALEQSRVHGVKQAWEQFNPTGRLDFRALVDIPAGQSEPHLDVTVTARGCTVVPEFFPYALNDLSGTVRYARGKVELMNLSARHGDSVVSLPEGAIYLKSGGGYYAKLPRLEANPLVLDAEFVRALPGPLQTALTTLQPEGPLALATELVVDTDPGKPPLVYWDGGVALRDAAVRLGVPVQKVSGVVFCRGRHNGQQLEGVVGNVKLEQASVFGQPLQNVQSHFEVWKETPDVLRVPKLSASLFGGDVGGQAKVEFGSTLRYELDLTALQVKLEQFGRHNIGAGTQFSGLASARLYLVGQGAELSGLEGRGSIDIPTGKMYNLPLLLDLLKFLSVRLPDRTMFEEAHARFTIHGPRVNISRLELIGNVISLGGQGEMALDGSAMNLDLYTVWGRVLQMLPPVIKDVPPWISKQLLKITMRGKIGEPKFDKEPVPLLVDPLKDLLQMLAGKESTAKDKRN